MEQKLEKKAFLALYTTIVWNVFEGITCMLAGFISGSIALFAYGLESSVEVFSSSVVVWELKGVKDKARERKALKLIGVAYLVVSIYVFIDASESLFAGHHPERTYIGMFLMITTAIAMGILGLIKLKLGNKMKSPTVLADAKFTLIDGALAMTVLFGLAFNTLFGWWWMDQSLALFLSGAAFREGLKEIL